MLTHLFESGLKIAQLRLKLLAMEHKHIEKFAQLYAGIAGAVVEINDLFGLGQ